MSEHGTISRYTNDECRCGPCRRAWNEYAFARRRERALEVPDDLHGKPSTYTNWACRCPACRQAHAEKMRGYYEKKRAKKKAS